MKNTAYFFISAISIVIMLAYGKSLLIPFVFAMLLWFVVRKIRQELNKVKFINKYFPTWLKNLIPSVLLVVTLAFIAKLLTANITVLTKSYSLYEGRSEERRVGKECRSRWSMYH